MAFIYSFLLVFMICCIAMPVFTFLHELGHAVVALACTKGKVYIYMGKNPNENGQLSFTIFKRLHLSFQLKGMFHGLCYWDGEMSDKQKIFFI